MPSTSDKLPRPPVLQEGDFIEVSRYRDSAEASIYSKAINLCREMMSRLVISPDFNPALVPKLLRDYVESIGIDSLIDSAARDEIKYSYVGTALLDAFGIARPETGFTFNDSWQGPLLLPTPVEFAEDLFKQIENTKVDFSKLQDMHTAYAGTKILEYIRMADDIARGNVATTEGATDTLFELAELAFFNPDYTLGANEEQMTYFLCFVPGMARRMFKEIMISNQIAQYLENSLGEMSPEEKEILANFLNVMRADALTGQSWYDFVSRFGSGAETNSRMSHYAVDALNALRAIQESLDKGLGIRVAECFKEAGKSLNSKLRDYASNDEAIVFSNTDIGHGLEAFRVHSLDDILSDFISSEYVNVEKDGSKAVIFENDRRQADLWKSAVSNYTQSEIEGSDVTDSVNHFLERAAEPDVSLVLIDIEDAQGNPVGIEAAISLINTKLKQFKYDESDKVRPIKIIVWSSSADRVKEANAAIRSLECFSDFDYSGGGGGVSRGKPVKVTVKQKLPNIRDLNDITRQN